MTTLPEGTPAPAGTKRWIATGVIIAALLVAGAMMWVRQGSSGEAGAATAKGPHVAARTPEEAGKYLVMVAGCHDCHTPGWMEKGLAVPESQWLIGVPIGWRGPWGTTYGSNLRRSANLLKEDIWVQSMRARNDRPPMPWVSLHAMAEQDLRAIYRYLRSLGPAGERTPGPFPPGEEPPTPYILLEPQAPKK